MTIARLSCTTSRDRTMTTIDEKLERLTDQVGRFTEGMTEFRMVMERNHQEFNQKLDRMAVERAQPSGI